MTDKTEGVFNKKQQGAALIVAMVVLLVMTLIGTSGMSQSLQSMRMSKGFRDYNYSHQFAEAGLRLAEEILKRAENQEDVVTDLQAVNISMKSAGNYTDPFYWGDVSLFSSDIPVKIVVHEWQIKPDSLRVGLGSLSAIVYYRITARSFDPRYQAYLEAGNSETDQLGQSQTVLQSTYAVRFE